MNPGTKKAIEDYRTRGYVVEYKKRGDIDDYHVKLSEKQKAEMKRTGATTCRD